jgi:hypothetical protein
MARPFYLDVVGLPNITGIENKATEQPTIPELRIIGSIPAK